LGIAEQRPHEGARRDADDGIVQRSPKPSSSRINPVTLHPCLSAGIRSFTNNLDRDPGIRRRRTTERLRRLSEL